MKERAQVRERWSLNNFKWIFIIIVLAIATRAPGENAISLEKMRESIIKIDKSIEETKYRIRNIKDARFLPDIYFTLAEFYVQKARFLYSIKIYENEGAPIEELDFTIERRPKLEAIAVYDTILEKFPNIPDRDKAIFFKAHELRELGRTEEMIREYRVITERYPSSEFWHESQLIIGDYFLEEKKDIDLALKMYNKILQRPLSIYTPLASYKVGWYYINKEKFKQALTFFEKALVLSNKVNLSLLPEQYKKTDIRTEALLAIVWPYSELSKKYLKSIGQKRHRPNIYFYSLSPDKTSYEKVLARLGRRLGIKKRWREATKIYFELLRISEKLEARLDVIEQLYVSMKNSRTSWPVRGFVQEIQKTVILLNERNEFAEAKRKKALHDLEIFARDVATRQHQRAKKEKTKQEWEYVIDDYQSYLWTFSESKYSSELRLNLAEAFFNSDHPLRAAKEYEKLAFTEKNAERKKSFFDSSIQSFVKVLSQPVKLSRLELTEARTGLRTVGEHYIKSYPQERAVPDIRFNIGQSYYDERSFSEAVYSLKGFIRKHPTNKNVSMAANLILDAFNQREDYKGLIAEGKIILSNRDIKDSSLKRQIKSLIQQSEMRMIQTKAGQFGSRKYTSSLLALAKKYRGSSLGDQAMYEAFVSLKAKKDPKAYEAAEQLIVQYGNSDYAQRAATEIAQMALVTADFHRAALYFELYFEKYPQRNESRDFLKNAAQIRESMGELQEAASNYRKLGDFTSVARIDFLAGSWQKLLESAEKSSGIEKIYWLGLANYRLNRKSEALPLLKSAAKIQGNDYIQQDMSSHARYLIAMEKLDAYEEIKMSSGNEAQAVQQKTEALKILVNELESVARSGSGRWAIAGLYGLGKVNGEFAKFIRDAPIPKGLSKSQLKQYREILKKQAAGYEKAAVNYFGQCMNSAEKYDVFSLFVEGCMSRGKKNVNEEAEMLVIIGSFGSSAVNVTDFRNKLQDDPRNVDVLLEMAAAYVKANDYALAELIFNRASELAPKNQNIKAQLGVLKIYQNRLMEAKRWLSEAQNDALGAYALASLQKKFNFNKKFKGTMRKAISLGKPKGITHPLMKSVY